MDDIRSNQASKSNNNNKSNEANKGNNNNKSNEANKGNNNNTINKSDNNDNNNRINKSDKDNKNNKSNKVNMSNTDNNFLYMIKGIACILVIFIHCLFPGTVGKEIQAASRFAVLYFFVVSGKYLLKGIPASTEAAIVRKKVASKILHVLITALTLTFIYNIYSFVIAMTVGFGAADLAAQKYNVHELWLLLMFNSGKIIYDYTYDFDHLWYIYAVLYVFILVFIFAKRAKKWSGFLAFLFTAMLFFAQLLQLYYPIRPFDISIRTWYVVRNWLLVGIPFIMGGVWLDSAANDNQSSKAAELCRRLIYSCSSGKKANRNRIIFIIIAIAGMFMAVIEYKRFGEMTAYVGSVVTIIALMILGEAYDKCDGVFIKGNLLSYLGKYLSANVYYFHVMILSIVGRIFFFLEKYPVYLWIKPIIVVIISVLVSELIHILKRKRSMIKNSELYKK